jgi:hypothetical protein
MKTWAPNPDDTRSYFKIGPNQSLFFKLQPIDITRFDHYYRTYFLDYRMEIYRAINQEVRFHVEMQLVREFFGNQG